MVGTVPRSLVDWMWPFIRCFPGATWDHVLVLVSGALLSPGRRTVTAGGHQKPWGSSGCGSEG